MRHSKKHLETQVRISVLKAECLFTMWLEIFIVNYNITFVPVLPSLSSSPPSVVTSDLQ